MYYVSEDAQSPEGSFLFKGVSRESFASIVPRFPRFCACAGLPLDFVLCTLGSQPVLWTLPSEMEDH